MSFMLKMTDTINKVNWEIVKRNIGTPKPKQVIETFYGTYYEVEEHIKNSQNDFDIITVQNKSNPDSKLKYVKEFTHWGDIFY